MPFDIYYVGAVTRNHIIKYKNPVSLQEYKKSTDVFYSLFSISDFHLINNNRKIFIDVIELIDYIYESSKGGINIGDFITAIPIFESIINKDISHLFISQHLTTYVISLLIAQKINSDMVADLSYIKRFVGCAKIDNIVLNYLECYVLSLIEFDVQIKPNYFYTLYDEMLTMSLPFNKSLDDNDSDVDIPPLTPIIIQHSTSPEQTLTPLMQSLTPRPQSLTPLMQSIIPPL